MPSPPPRLRIIETSLLAPPPGAVPESSVPLTFFDILWLPGGYVERLFFYPLPHSTSHFIASVLPVLKSSLSLALSRFYPLSGKIRCAPGSLDRYEIHYADGDFVPFTLAEIDDDFDYISGSHSREYTRLLPLKPWLPDADADGSRQVLAVQVTLLPNRGVVLGVAVHHAACDGASSMRFLSSWASACARSEEKAPIPPVIARSLILDPSNLYTIILRSLGIIAEVSESMTALQGAVIGSFTLKAEQLRLLKEFVFSKAAAGEGSATRFNCSTVVMTYAYAWVCLVKAKSYSDEKMVPLVFPCDCRGRLRPSVPAEYFGNCLSFCFVDAKTGDLVGEGGIVAAARAIGEAIERFKDDPLKDADKWIEKYMSVADQQPLSVAGSPSFFRVYDVDFGWGRPVKVEIPSIARTGAMSVAESRDEGGGVEIGFVLPKAEMERFGAHFSDGLKRKNFLCGQRPLKILSGQL